MNYSIFGDSDCPIVQASLKRGETIKVERGSMVYISNVELEGKMNSGKKGIGGVLGAIGRSMTSGESMFITMATGTADDGFIGIAPPIPGKIHCLSVACDQSVEYLMKKQDLGKAVFAGTGGLFVMETQGEGDILVSAFGDLLALNITDEHPITIDNEHVVAWDANLQYDIHVASGTFGFKTGEGLVNEFHGNGTVLIQTRNLHNFADSIRPFLPSSTSN